MNTNIKPQKRDPSFDARKAAKAIFEVMKRMGLDTSGKPGCQHWFGFDTSWTKDFATISLGNNTMFIHVRETGFSLMSRSAIGGGWSTYSTSYDEFRERMPHVLFYFGIPEYVHGKKNPQYKRQYQKYRYTYLYKGE